MTETPDPNEFIKIHHPDLPGETGECTRAALEEVWSETGWEEGESEPPTPAEGKAGPPHRNTTNTDPKED
jgi:hypothetical protein